MVPSSLVQPFLHFLLHYGQSLHCGLRPFLTLVVQELPVTSVHSPFGGVIIPVVGISIIGWKWFDSSMYVNSWNPHNVPTFEAIGVSISMTLWAFLGLESACANSDAVENPEKNVPIAVLGGTLGAAVIYIVSTNVIAGIVPNLELANSTAPFGLAFAHMFDETIGKVIMGLMVMSCFGSLLGWQFTIAQVFKSSAEEGYFPAFFKKVTSKVCTYRWYGNYHFVTNITLINDNQPIIK